MTFPLNIRSLQTAVSSVCEEISKMKLQALHWQAWKENELWRELAGCILGSQVPYEQAVAAVSYLHSTGLLYPTLSRSDLRQYERQLKQALIQPIFPSKKNSAVQQYRFPVLRANHLRRTAEAIYLRGASLREILSLSCDGLDARIRIVSVAIGAGPKQASLFLRNVGYADDLAILDRHVLKYMTWTRLTSSRLDNRVDTIGEYERIETAFRIHAQQMGFSVANLDLAVWIVVRVIQKEFAQ